MSHEIKKDTVHLIRKGTQVVGVIVNNQTERHATVYSMNRMSSDELAAFFESMMVGGETLSIKENGI